MTRDPTVAMAIETAHQVAMLTAAAVDASPANIIAGTSGAMAATLPISVRLGVLGTMIARAITVLAHASRPAYAPIATSSPSISCSRTR